MSMVAWGGNQQVHTGACLRVEVVALFCSSELPTQVSQGVPKVVVLLGGFFVSNK